MKRLVVLATWLLTGCSIISSQTQDISQNPVKNIPVIGPYVADDLAATDFNFQSAANLGILKKEDPIVSCTHEAAQEANAAGASFEPKIAGIASLLSIAYIQRVQSARLQQAILTYLGCLSAGAGPVVPVPTPLAPPQKPRK